PFMRATTPSICSWNSVTCCSVVSAGRMETSSYCRCAIDCSLWSRAGESSRSAHGGRPHPGPRLLFRSAGRLLAPRREAIHRRLDALGNEEFGGIRRPADRLVDRRPLIALESRKHVIRQVPARIAASHPNSKPRELSTDVLNHRPQSVVPAGRSHPPEP